VLAAYSRLVEEDSFKLNVLPRKAKQLALGLSQALAALFPHSADVCQATLIHTWGERPEVYRDRQTRFTKIFEVALRLKCATITKDQLFEFVVYPPGTLSQKHSDTLPRNSGHQSSGIADSSMTRFWQHASIHVYNPPNAAPEHSQDPIADALVSTKNFVSKNDSDRTELSLHSRIISIEKCEDSSRAASQNITSTTLSDEPGSTTQGIVSRQTKMGNNSKALHQDLGRDLQRERTREVEKAEPLPDTFMCKTCWGYYSSKDNLSRHESLGRSDGVPPKRQSSL